MNGIADLLLAIWEAIMDMVAPYEIICEWEQGVKTKWGKIVKTCKHTNGVRGTGLHFYWPIIGGLDTHDCNLSTMQSDDQTLTTSDGETVVVAMTLAYRITDAGRFYRWIHDQDETIQNVIESAVGRAVPKLNWWKTNKRKDWGLVENLVDMVTEEITPKLRKWGVEPVDLATHTMVKCRTYRLIT